MYPINTENSLIKHDFLIKNFFVILVKFSFLSSGNSKQYLFEYMIKPKNLNLVDGMGLLLSLLIKKPKLSNNFTACNFDSHVTFRVNSFIASLKRLLFKLTFNFTV